MTLNIPDVPLRRTTPVWIAAVLAVVIAAVVVAVTPTQAKAIATSVPLGTAGSFGVLAGTTVTNTGDSVISQDLGVSPGTAITGFPPGVVLGQQHSADAVALQAQSDLVVAYDDAAGQDTDFALDSGIGNGETLLPGVHTAESGVGLTGDLVLDADGDPSAVWVFQIPEALTTASASRVLLTNGASPCNVYWQIGSSATIGTNSTFVGTIMALTSISVTTGANIDGRALARNAAVTLDTNNIFLSACGTGTTGGAATGGAATGGAATGGAATGGAATGGAATGGAVPTGGAATGGAATGGAATGGAATGGDATGGANGGETGGKWSRQAARSRRSTSPRSRRSTSPASRRSTRSPTSALGATSAITKIT